MDYSRSARSGLSLGYSVSGNISYKSDVGTYLYGQNGAGPHAVSSAGGVSYSYDANGNQVSGDGRTLSYTLFDQPEVISKGSAATRFDYGIGQGRYRREDVSNGSVVKTTLYFAGVERITAGNSSYYQRDLGGVALQPG